MVPLASFRGVARPVLLAGSAGYINRALKASELYRTELRLRGISVIPVVLSSKDPGEKLRALKAEFRSALNPRCWQTSKWAIPLLRPSDFCSASCVDSLRKRLAMC